MKNSNIELLGEFLSHTPDPQSNYEKRELLYPISKQFDFEVDFKRILFREETPEKGLSECEIPFSEIYSIYHGGGFLYILCMNGVLISFDVKRNASCFISLLDGISPMEMWMWRCRRWVKTRWNSLFHIGDDLY